MININQFNDDHDHDQYDFLKYHAERNQLYLTPSGKFAAISKSSKGFTLQVLGYRGMITYNTLKEAIEEGKKY